MRRSSKRGREKPTKAKTLRDVKRNAELKKSTKETVDSFFSPTRKQSNAARGGRKRGGATRSKFIYDEAEDVSAVAVSTVVGGAVCMSNVPRGL